MKFAAAVILLLALASVATARPVGLRSVLALDTEKEPIYCTGEDHAEDECPEHYECVALDKKACKQVQKCEKDAYGKNKCTYEKQCWEYECVEIPKYCEVSYTGKDECVTKYSKYGKDLECQKLKKRECVYEKECEYVDTDKCKVYDKYKKGCKVYEQKEVCKDVEVCWTGKCVEVPKYGK